MIMEGLLTLHQTNIIVHVTAGSVALLLGLLALVVKKGGKQHKFIGNIFLIFLSIVIVTGLLGVLVFGRNTFLLVLTILSGYSGYSGYRIVKQKNNSPKITDIVVALVAVSSGLYFVYYFKSIGMIWSPVIIYSTVGYLFLMVVYDVLRYFIPAGTYKKMWLYEHIVKMTGAFSGLLSAFSGTVFEQYQPYSQFLPSVAGTIAAIAFVVYYYKKSYTFV